MYVATISSPAGRIAAQAILLEVWALLGRRHPEVERRLHTRVLSVNSRRLSEKVSLCGQAFYTLFPLEKQGRQYLCRAPFSDTAGA